MNAAQPAGPAPDAETLNRRLRVVQAALAAGHWTQAQAEGEALHHSAQGAGQAEVAANAALAVAKALFNADLLEPAEQWCERVRESASQGQLPALLAAGWVVAAAVRARQDHTVTAIAAVNEALGCLNDRLPAVARRTVYFGVAITYRGLGLWHHAVGAWRAAVEADRTIGRDVELVVSRMNLIECASRAYDDLCEIDATAAQQQLDEMLALEHEVSHAATNLPAGWLRFRSHYVLGGLRLRCRDFEPARELLLVAVNEEAQHAAAARGAAWLELGLAQSGLGDLAAALASAAQARIRLDGDARGPAGLRPLPGLHDLWRVERLSGHHEAAVALLAQFHQRVVRNMQALLDAQVAGLTRQLSAQTLRLQNADLREHNADLARSVEDISLVARTDPLTGVLNRRAIEEAFAGTQNEGQRCVLAMIDLDHFKAVNDTYSHGVGDAVLRRVASSIQEGMRARDRLGRYGGEEFTLLLADLDLAAGAVVVDRLRQQIAAVDWSALAVGLVVTISAGLVDVVRGERFEQSAARADRLLYEAKRLGRNRVVSESLAASTAEG